MMSPTVAELVRRILLGMAAFAAFSCGSLHSPQDAPPEVRVQTRVHPELTTLSLGRVGVLPFHPREGLNEQAAMAREAVLVSFRQLEVGDVIGVELSQLGPDLDREQAVWGASRPRELLIRAHRQYGVDSVLFGTVTHAQVYGDPALGLELVLVDARDGRVLWLGDDVLDARVPGVREALNSFRQLEVGALAEDEDSRHLPFDSFARFVARSFGVSLREDL